ncbi:MAG: N-acetyl-gamma-glutamyl-phosphate reductase [Prevotellaceae bacterium]|jgi:N-acetyl-gamma-glutamyl-phosphate reductase|nr:N-acetyl-gamma-glutamyl-phosphate reductase [Prevotellaceae bacterium]
MPRTKNKPVKIGIVGGAGYTAGELIRILINHPQAEIAFVQSSSQGGQPLHSIHRDLLGETEMKFTDTTGAADVIFLCLSHGLSTEFLNNNAIDEHCKIIDLGNDFRLNGQHRERTFIYGLPEMFRDDITKADNIANPGCFATAIQLALLPIAKQSLIEDEVHANAITGSTGAGRGLSETSQFSYRNNNVSAYKVFTHQHLGEIGKTLRRAQQGREVKINFVPVRGNFARGIFATLYTSCRLTKEEAEACYTEYYSDHPFVHVASRGVSMKEAVNTNKCILQIEKHGDYLFVTSIIDNLIKGASGQAVQNMNLMFGIEETSGLHLKSITF